MKSHLQASISVRGESGVSFGTLRRFEDGVALFETSGLYELGEVVELRIELPRMDATVFGHAGIYRRRERDGLPTLYKARFKPSSGRDQRLLQAWLEERWEEGLAERSSTTAGTGDPRNLRRISSALRAFDERHGSTPTSTSWGITTEPSKTRGGLGREAIRRALRSALAADRGEPPPPEPKPARPEPPPRKPTPTIRGKPALPPLRAAEGGLAEQSQLQDPQVHWDLASQPPRLLLRYRGLGPYVSDYEQYLSRGAALVPGKPPEPALPRGSSLELTLMLPSGLALQLQARVEIRMSQGTGLSIELDAAKRAALLSELPR